jgi:hypothetical protein
MNCIQLYSGYPSETLHEELALMPAGETILIDLLSEGGVFIDPDPESTHTSRGMDLFTVIHEQCSIASVDPSLITLWWGNVNVQDLYDMWCEENNPSSRLTVAYYTLWGSTLVTNTTDYHAQYEVLRNNTQREKLFTYLCGEPRHYRIEAMNYIYENNLIDSCEWTWVNDSKKELHPWFHDKIPKSAEGHKNVMERRTFHDPGKEFFDIYDRTYFDLVPETLYYHDMFHHDELAHWEPVFFSEKIFRSIYNKRPFLLIGNKNSLKELRKMGFKTFPHIFDESYDSLDDDERMNHVLEQLKGLSIEQMHIDMYSLETAEILQHNYDTLMIYHSQYGDII